MKRPVLGTVSILVLLGVGVFVALKYKDAPPREAPKTCYEGAAARQAILGALELALSGNARDVWCCVEMLGRTQLVFARFDVSDAELAGLFDGRSRFPRLGDLKADLGLIRSMNELASPARPWWQVGQLANPTAAQTSGRRGAGPSAVKWRIQLCTSPLNPSGARVYVAVSEEPVGEGAE